VCPLRTVNVCLMTLSRLGSNAPSFTAANPLWTGSSTIVVRPVVVQPDRPDSNALLTTAPVGAMTASEYDATLVAEAALLVLASTYTPIGVEPYARTVTLAEADASTPAR